MSKQTPGQEAILLLAADYIATYEAFSRPQAKLSGFTDPHDAAYSFLSDILAEAVALACQKIDSGSASHDQ